MTLCRWDSEAYDYVLLSLFYFILKNIILICVSVCTLPMQLLIFQLLNEDNSRHLM